VKRHRIATHRLLDELLGAGHVDTETLVQIASGEPIPDDADVTIDVVGNNVIITVEGRL
jgi:hypothetical protein